MTSDEFLPAGELGAEFHADVIRPLLGDTPYAAGLLGWGSDVLGYDTVRSTDHGWGPRLNVFVDADEVDRVTKLVEDSLPETYRGHAVRFGWDTQEDVHHIKVSTLASWLTDHVGFDPNYGLSDPAEGLRTEDWLITPQQKLLGVVAGSVYADDGRLQPVRDALKWYPDELWIWLLACQWSRIGEEETFVQRTEEVGDHLGSRVVAARLTRDLMRLALLMERTYAPYTKWLGTAFARLPLDDGLDRVLAEAVAADSQADRERALTTAYELVGRRHNALGITAEVDPTPRQFHERPAMVIAAGRFVHACLDQVRDPLLRKLELVGSIDQFADNTELLSNPVAYRRLARIYQK